jgi:hypothetical protein
MMNERGKSDWPVVPGKPANKGDGAPSSAEQVEGRGQAKGNLIEQSSHRAQYRDRLSQALDRVRQAARRLRSMAIPKRARKRKRWIHAKEEPTGRWSAPYPDICRFERKLLG